ncbi:MAG: hypothetical protein NTU88_08375, partial [Armatimonadetes bacterium]|nr:hypothetical protein [Armatimonadota bacterium]
MIAAFPRGRYLSMIQGGGYVFDFAAALQGGYPHYMRMGRMGQRAGESGIMGQLVLPDNPHEHTLKAY